MSKKWSSKSQQEHTGRVFRLQFDEFQIVSSSHDDTILIWDFLNYTPPERAVEARRSPSRKHFYAHDSSSFLILFKAERSNLTTYLLFQLLWWNTNGNNRLLSLSKSNKKQQKTKTIYSIYGRSSVWFICPRYTRILLSIFFLVCLNFPLFRGKSLYIILSSPFSTHTLRDSSSQSFFVLILKNFLNPNRYGENGGGKMMWQMQRKQYIFWNSSIFCR